TGVWEAFAAGAGAGARYQYEVTDAAGRRTRKSDPVGFAGDLRPDTASRVWDLAARDWGDDAWLERRAGRDPRREPISMYEVHLGSWRHVRLADGSARWLTYREAAPLLAEHCRRFGFTHVEFLPLAEHPYDRSWGYQVSGYFAPTARYGTPDDLRALVDELHGTGIGVILDWVPAHFPRDEPGLAQFDGTSLYEHPDPRRGAHPDWGTLIFDYGRPQVRDFLISNARFWLETYHVDGLRVDAVASMLYLDYSRGPGEWLPNEHGGNENLEAVSLLQQVNERIAADFPGAFTVAEESTAWPRVTRPPSEDGLGFTFKWDLGWMHDTLDFFRAAPADRPSRHDRLTFRSVYAFSEAFVLPLSHDEVVHMKGSLLGKMPGDERERFASLRALLGGMFTQPGKKLLFMGTELASLAEWDESRALPWHEADDPLRAAFGEFLRDLGTLYREHRVLWADDDDPTSFAWIDAGDVENSVFIYRRGDPARDHVVVIQSLGGQRQERYGVGFPRAGRYGVLIDSDRAAYGGSGDVAIEALDAAPVPLRGQPASAEVILPPLTCLILRPEP
ncbi:MAG: 1,4-alpha-glucan branching protein GlgB, partial [Chloroflexota bacterium]|nr:1,4-alpha-glucan branching protein GlgB [Chloroflexota bacterium]